MLGTIPNALEKMILVAQHLSMGMSSPSAVFFDKALLDVTTTAFESLRLLVDSLALDANIDPEPPEAVPVVRAFGAPLDEAPELEGPAPELEEEQFLGGMVVLLSVGSRQCW